MMRRSCKRCDGPVEKWQRVCLSCKTQLCEWCGGEFVDHHARKYCSHRCQHDHRSHDAITDHRFDCRGCGAAIQGARSRSGKGRTQRWCSRECRSAHAERKRAFRRHLYRVERALNPRTTKDGECRECGAEAPDADFYKCSPRACIECECARGRRYYAQNRERSRARVRRYKHANPERVAMWGQRRWRLIAERSDGTVTPDALQSLLDGATSCYWCGRGFNRRRRKTVDHVVPVDSSLPDDRIIHTMSNLCVSCGTCNSSKSNHLPREWTATGQLHLVL